MFYITYHTCILLVGAIDSDVFLDFGTEFLRVNSSLHLKLIPNIM